MSEGERASVVFVGAGAAGLAAAIFTARAREERGLDPAPIVVLDGARRIGAKILVSGGGRCNVTHDVVRPEDYHGDRRFVRRVLRAFDERAARAWFEELGVPLKLEETGKWFPVSDSARTVLGALLDECDRRGVEVRTSHRVRAIVRAGTAAFRIEHEAGAIIAPRVVLATGGRSLPKSGSDGQGYDLARSLGHTVTETWPALVPLLLDDRFLHAALSGVSHPVRLTVRVAGKKTDERSGDLLWTHFGVSGPVTMDISRSWVRPHEEGRSPTLEAHLVPDSTREELEASFLAEGRRAPGRTVVPWLADRLPKRVARAVVAHAGLSPDARLAQVERASRKVLLATLCALELPVIGPRGWNQAEVTAGGVPLAEVDPRTLGSRLVPGLSLVGEILDVDGPIGGFNFQWAWAGGRVVGEAIARDEREAAAGPG